MSTFVSIKSDDETTLVELIHEIHTKKMQQLSRVVEEYSNRKNKNWNWCKKNPCWDDIAGSEDSLDQMI